MMPANAGETNVSRQPPGESATGQGLFAWYALGFSDPLGDRLLLFDNTDNGALELLRLRPELNGVGAIEFSLRERARELEDLDDPHYAKVRRVDRLPEPGGGIAIVSVQTPGERLSDLLALTAKRRRLVGDDVVLPLSFDLLAALAVLHGRGAHLAHGAVSPERLIVTPSGHLLITEYILGSALRHVRTSGNGLWPKLRLVGPSEAFPPAFDQRLDVIQAGAVALSLTLGRAIDPSDWPAGIPSLLDEAADRASGTPWEQAWPSFRRWLEIVLGPSLETVPADAMDAARVFREIVSPVASRPSDLSVQAFLTECGRMLSIAGPSEPGVLPGPSEVRPALPPPARMERAGPGVVEAAAPVEVPATARVAVAVGERAVAAPLDTPIVPVEAPEPARVAAAAGERAVAAPPDTPIVPARGEPPGTASDVGPAQDRDASAPGIGRTPGRGEGQPGSSLDVDLAFPWNRPSRPADFLLAEPLAKLEATRRGVTELAPETALPRQPEPAGSFIPRGGAKGRRALLIVAVVAACAAALFGVSRLAGPRGGTVAPPTTGVVAIETEPAGATVTVDGADVGLSPARFDLAPGKHEVGLRLGTRYRQIVVEVAAGGLFTHHVEMGATPEFGQLEVRSTPEPAKVLIDGQPRGMTPLVVDRLTPGVHEVVLEGRGGTARERVTVVAGALATLIVPLPVSTGAGSGWLVVESPVELQIVEDGRLIGTSLSDRTMMSAGRHDLQLVSESLGYRSSHSVTVAAGRTATVAVDLPKARIDINALPWADVSIDGVPVGQTPLGGVETTIGRHVVVFRHPQLGERRVECVVTLGRPVRLSQDLRK